MSNRYGMPERFPTLREAENVDDLKQRDRLVRKIRRVRKLCLENKADIEHWNRAHPNEAPIGTAFDDAMLRYQDGTGTWSQVEAAYRSESVHCPACGFIPKEPRGRAGETCVWCHRGKYRSPVVSA